MQRAGGTLLTPPGVEYACTVMSSDSSADAEPTPNTAGSGTADDAADRRDDLVDAVCRYRDAEYSMRSRSRHSMHLGKTDMTALRLMLRAGRGGRPLSAAALASELSISTAATTVLVNRLEESSHAERRRSATGEGTSNQTATGVDVLNALRAYRKVENGLRRRLSQRLNINETDLGALRHLLGVWQRDQGASPKDLALALGISSASTTLVIDRLEKAGFIRRRRHPVDRRAVILDPGEKATEEFHSAFDVEKRGVLAAADGLTNEQTETVTRFLRSMQQAISDAVGQPERSQDAVGHPDRSQDS